MANISELSNADLLRALAKAKRDGEATAAAEPPAPMAWGDVPMKALQNAPGSAVEFGKNLIHPFFHPIDTAKNLYDLGKGVVAKTGAIDDPEAEAKADAVGRFFVDRYGSMENFKRTLAEDPVGVLADAATVISGGSALGARAPGIVGQTARVAGKVGRIIDPLTVVGKTAKVAGSAIAAPILGMTTGAGARAFREAGRAGLQNNDTFASHMRGYGDIAEPVEMARRGVSKLRADRGAQYNHSMAGVKANQSPIDMRQIDQAMVDIEDMIAPDGFVISEDALKVFRQIRTKVDEFAGMTPTPANVDQLKKALGEIRMKTLGGTLERKVADSVFHATKDAIVSGAPDYATAMKGYSDASETIDDISRTFSTGENASKDTTLRKLQSTMRNNVNTNYGARTELGDELGALEPNLMPALAGQALNSPTPRGIQGALAGGSAATAIPAAAAGLLDPTYLSGLALTSPRLMGEAAYLSGRAGGAVGNAVGRGTYQAGRIGMEGAMIPLRGAAASAEPVPSLETMSDEELMELLRNATGR